MYSPVQTRRFKRSFKKLQGSGVFTSSVSRDFKTVITTLMKGGRLHAHYRDHSLTGELKEYRECHIKGDLLLIYRRDEGARVIDLVDIGSHTYLFG